MALPRRFHLDRGIDTTGMSGTGHVADGVVWHDGTASVIWLSPHPSIAFWYRIGAGMTDAEWVHTHGGTADTRIVWDDPEPSPGDATGIFAPDPDCETGDVRTCTTSCSVHGYPTEAQQDTVRTVPDNARTPDGQTPGQPRTPETPQASGPGQQDRTPDAEQDTTPGPSSYPYLDTLGVLLSRMVRGVLLEAERPLLREHVEHLLADRSRSEHAAARLMEQRQEMAEERYAWQERGRKAERAADLLADSHRRAERAEAALVRVCALRGPIAEALEQADYRMDMQRGDLADSVMPVILDAMRPTPADGACRPVEVDGETIRVHGQGQFTEREQGYVAEIVRAAKRKYEAEHPAAGQADDSSPTPTARPDAEQQASSTAGVGEMPVTVEALAQLLAAADIDVNGEGYPTWEALTADQAEQYRGYARFVLQRCHITTKSAPAAGPCAQHPHAPVIGGTCSGCIVDPADEP